MTKSGDPLENAVAECVNSILKMEWLNYESFLDVRDVRAIVAEIVNIYNSKRKHLSLGYRAPAQAYGMYGEMDRR